MLRIFLRQNKLIIVLWCLIFVTITGQSLWSQSQNPFEIISRKYIDSIQVTSENTHRLYPDISGQITAPAEQNRIDTGRTGTLIVPMAGQDSSFIHPDNTSSGIGDSTTFTISGMNTPSDSSA